MHSPITCLNGVFMPAANAVLPVADRGFRFGDGVFETIRIVRGTPYQWEIHTARLMAGLATLRITGPEVDFVAMAKQTLLRNHATDGFLRISVSRGVGSAGYMPQPTDIRPNWVMEYLPPRPAPAAPYRLWLSSYTRPHPSSMPSNHKLAQGVSSTLALLEAAENGCEDALQRTADGVVSCAASANFFWIKGRMIFTPSLSTGCLSGTMRAAVMRCSGGAIHECEADISTLETADAAFISNARLGVWPISAIEPLGISFNPQHPVFEQLQRDINSDIESYISANNKLWSQ